MTDEEMKAAWRCVKTPREALETLIQNSEFIGTDPYYRDLNAALWEMAERVLKETES